MSLKDNILYTLVNLFVHDYKCKRLTFSLNFIGACAFWKLAFIMHRSTNLRLYYLSQLYCLCFCRKFDKLQGIVATHVLYLAV